MSGAQSGRGAVAVNLIVGLWVFAVAHSPTGAKGASVYAVGGALGTTTISPLRVIAESFLADSVR